MRAIHSDNGVKAADSKLSVVYIAAGCMDADDFADAPKGLGWMDISIEAVCGNSEALDTDEERFRDLTDTVRHADLVILRMHGDGGYFVKLPRLIAQVSRAGCPMVVYSTIPSEVERFRHLFPYSESTFDSLSVYLEIGGVKNYTSLLLWACKTLKGIGTQVPGPDIPSAQGVYVPKGVDMTERQYLASLDGTRPTVGLVLNHGLWSNRVLETVDRLISMLRGSGADVLPVYMKSVRSDSVGALGASGTFRRYFLKGRRPRVDAIIMFSGFSQRIMDGADGNPFEIVGVPVLQSPMFLTSVKEWEEEHGLSATELSVSVVQTEFDGQILSPPSHFRHREGNELRYEYSEERLRRVSDSALAWCRLRRLPRAETKVAIVLNRSSSGRIGGARGLDVTGSLRRVIATMAKRGYSVDAVPKSQATLARVLESVCAGASDLPDGYALPASVSSGRYADWFSELPRFIREKIVADHGRPPGQEAGGIGVPGVLDGNIFIGIEPSFGYGTNRMPSHEFVAFYRWITDVFRADAVVHMGDHGELEWLDGKVVGLGRGCMPDILLGTTPLIYPFAVDDVANGLVAKRRSHAVLVSHMMPPVSRMDADARISELQARLQDAIDSKSRGRALDIDAIGRIRALMEDTGLWKDLSMNEAMSDSDIETEAPRIYDYISDVLNERVEEGLHVFGMPSRAGRLRSTVRSVLEYPNGNTPSLIQALAGSRVDPIDAAAYPRQPGEAEEADAIIRSMALLDFDPGLSCSAMADQTEAVRDVIRFACETVVPGIRGCTREMDSLMDALEGRYVPSGPSGSPFFGRADVLPTGTNLYSTDTSRIPTEAGWKAGCALAEGIIGRSIATDGRYPRSVVVVVNGGSTMVNSGSDIACAMSLVGLRPVWGTYGGRLSEVVPIPIEELGRPRIDVRLSVSSAVVDLFRDTFEMFERGMDAISKLDEGEATEEYNRIIRDRLVTDIVSGIVPDDCWRSMPRLLKRSRDPDVVISDTSALISGIGIEDAGTGTRILMADMRNPYRPRVRDVREEVSLFIRTRVMSPMWLRCLKAHGFSGAAEVSRLVERLLRWGSIEGATSSWMFDVAAESFVFDRQTREWMSDCNPGALCDILGDLMDAVDKGYWSADDLTVSRITDLYIAAEGDLEEFADGGAPDEHRARDDRHVDPHRYHRDPHGCPQAGGADRDGEEGSF